jgi:hypothetical protein
MLTVLSVEQTPLPVLKRSQQELASEGYFREIAALSEKSTRLGSK